MSRLSRPRDVDLVAALTLVLVGSLLAALSFAGWPAAAASIPAVLLAPGYALAAALFPPGFVTRGERAVLTVSLGVAVWALGGLLLQVFVGLGRPAWILLAIAATGLAAAAAQAARDELPPATAARPWPRLGRRGLAAALAALAIAGASIAIASGGQRSQADRSHFTSLWMLPRPSAAAYGGPGGVARPVAIGVENREGRDLTYRLVVTLGGRDIRRWRLRLGAGREWRALLPPAAIGGPGPLLASLYRGDALYRRVALKDRGGA